MKRLPHPAPSVTARRLFHPDIQSPVSSAVRCPDAPSRPGLRGGYRQNHIHPAIAHGAPPVFFLHNSYEDRRSRLPLRLHPCQRRRQSLLINRLRTPSCPFSRSFPQKKTASASCLLPRTNNSWPDAVLSFFFPYS